MQSNDNNKNRGAHGDSSFMLGGLPSSSENCPCVDKCQQYQMERMGHSTNYMLQRYQEYLKTKEAQINNDMMEFYNNLDPKTLEQNAQENI